MALTLRREPRTDDELWWLIKALWGIEMPRVSVCPGHISPFEALAHAYFAREPNFAVWYASRGSGKSLALAVLGATKNAVLDANVTILGGSMTQSQNVSAHIKNLYETGPNAPVHALRGGSLEKGFTVTQLTLASGKWVRPIPASQTTVRGPHPPLQLLDEVDEMDETIFNASLGQAMQQLNVHGMILDEYIVASSTWQNPIGTFTNLIDKARREGLPIFTWCWRELLEENGGWMSRDFIERKKRAVSEEMWRTEYELNEPSGTSRAIDLEAVEEYFTTYGPTLHEEHAEGDRDDYWVWEEPEANGLYAAGADWAKEKDKTVLAVVRYDVFPRKLVALRRMNKMRYPIMTGAFDQLVKKYRAVAQHDKTGVGNAINDYLSDDAAKGFVMVGRQRSQMFVDYIADFEKGGYRLPRNVEMFYRAHRGATTADVYAPHKWDSHTPDDLVAMAMAHRAAGRVPAGLLHDGTVSKLSAPRREDRDFHVAPYADDFQRHEGGVTIVDERYDDDVAVFDLSI
jgi:hypothetical protein